LNNSEKIDEKVKRGEVYNRAYAGIFNQLDVYRHHKPEVAMELYNGNLGWCINTGIRGTPSTFRLFSYSDNTDTKDILIHLATVLIENVDHKLLFFRIIFCLSSVLQIQMG
jgi:hypothetical protein